MLSAAFNVSRVHVEDSTRQVTEVQRTDLLCLATNIRDVIISKPSSESTAVCLDSHLTAKTMEMCVQQQHDSNTGSAVLSLGNCTLASDPA